jgi:hemerythrin-like metal-binding protein
MVNRGLELTDELSTAITFLDKEHLTLFQNYLALTHKVENKNNYQGLAEDFRKLVEDARNHFNHEERVMCNINYPYFREHKATHDRMVSDLADFLFNIEESFSPDDFHALVEFFKYWFFRHLKEHDVRLKSFIDRFD